MTESSHSFDTLMGLKVEQLPVSHSVLGDGHIIRYDVISLGQGIGGFLVQANDYPTLRVRRGVRPDNLIKFFSNFYFLRHLFNCTSEIGSKTLYYMIKHAYNI